MLINEIIVSPARNGYSLCYGGKMLLSAYNPIKQGERAVEDVLPLKNRTLYLCPSPLFGYGLDLLLKNLPQDSSVLCVEADRVLSIWTADHFCSPHLSHLTEECRLKLIYTENPLVLCNFVQKTFGKRAFRRVITIKLNSGWQIQERVYAEMEKLLTRNITIEWSNAMTLSKLGRLYARNAVKNLPLLATAKNAACIDLSGRNVLVLGAGPSLDDALDALFVQKLGETPADKCFVICVDTALGALIERNIKPDLVVALESQHWNLRDFVGAPPVPIAMDLSALPATAKRCQSPSATAKRCQSPFVTAKQCQSPSATAKRCQSPSATAKQCQSPSAPYLFWTQWTEMRFFQKLKTASLLPLELPAVGSVGLSAVALALKLNAKKVLCAGLDFSFTIDKYHCKGSPSYRASLRLANRFNTALPFKAAFRTATFDCTAKDGSIVRSDPAMKNYRDLFSMCFSDANNLYDIKNSGLPLGVKSLTYKEAIEFIREHEAVMTGTVSAALVSGTMPVFGATDNAALNYSSFIKTEITNLKELLQILQGKKNADIDTLEKLIDETDYLWAHFPDCAGAGGQRPPATDITFLKRLRIEIEPFLKLFLCCNRSPTEF